MDRYGYKDYTHRVDPKLRMICNGDEEVNTLRAELSGTVQVSKKLAGQFKKCRDHFTTDAIKKEDSKGVPKLSRLSDDVKVSVFVELDSESKLPPHFPRPTSKLGQLLTVELSQREIQEMAEVEGISYLAVGDALSAPTPTPLPVHVEAPAPRRVNVADTGAGVLIGLIDVGGFDFTHPDFLHEDGTTRFHSIWDQGGKGRAPKKLGFRYGSELKQEDMNKAIRWGQEHHVGATDLLSQSVQVTGSHGTHVASIAAGNKGVCPGAVIAGVLITLSREDQERRQSLYDSTRLIHGIEYLFALGKELELPVVINISLGTNGHAHDGSSPVSRWIDAALNVPGRCVCVAAGNAGKEAPQFEGDLGHMMGRIHTSGRIPASGLDTDIEWQVVGNGITDGSENEIEIWYEPQDQFEVLIKSPSGEWFGPVGPGQFIENKRLESGTVLSIYCERYHVSNGANRISIFLSPRLKEPYIGVEAGTWTIRLHGVSIRDGRFDAWIERDDPRPLGRVGRKEFWRFPSYFNKTSNVDRSSVNSLGCGHRVISVANFHEADQRINLTSSQGPTRDGRFKPEVAAPGTDVVAANGFSSPDRRWIAMTGTSMASPYVAGVAALMLARENRLTASQILGIIRRTAQPLPGADYAWQDGAGFGRIMPGLCLEEAENAFQQTDISQETAK